MEKKWITVMGSFVADLAFRAKKLPGWGETLLGSDFKLGPGGKGSNQAVAAARLGARVSFISQLGHDAFGDLARQTYKAEGIDTQFLFTTAEHPTGAASIIVDEVRGENSIVVVPGACFELSPLDVEKAEKRIAGVCDLCESARDESCSSRERIAAGENQWRCNHSQPCTVIAHASGDVPRMRLPDAERDRGSWSDELAGENDSRMRNAPPISCFHSAQRML